MKNLVQLAILLLLACAGTDSASAQTARASAHQHDVDSGTFGGAVVHWTPNVVAGAGVAVGTFALRMPGMRVRRDQAGRYFWGQYGAFLSFGVRSSIDPHASPSAQGTRLWAGAGGQGSIRHRWLTRTLANSDCRVGVEVGGSFGTMNLANAAVGGELAAIAGTPLVCEVAPDVTLAIVPQGGIAAATTFGSGSDLHGYGNVQAGARIDIASRNSQWVSLEYLARIVPTALHSARENGYVGHHILLVYQQALEPATLARPNPTRVLVFAVGSDYRSPWDRPIDGSSIWQFILGGGARFM